MMTCLKAERKRAEQAEAECERLRRELDVWKTTATQTAESYRRAHAQLETALQQAEDARAERDEYKAQLSEGTDDAVPYTAHAWRARCRAMEAKLDQARAALRECQLSLWWEHAHYDPQRDAVGHDFTSDAEAIEDALCTCDTEHWHARGCPLGPQEHHKPVAFTREALAATDTPGGSDE